MGIMVKLIWNSLNPGKSCFSRNARWMLVKSQKEPCAGWKSHQIWRAPRVCCETQATQGENQDAACRDGRVARATGQEARCITRRDVDGVRVQFFLRLTTFWCNILYVSTQYNIRRGLLWAAETWDKWHFLQFLNKTSPDMNRLHFQPFSTYFSPNYVLKLRILLDSR